MLRTFTAVISTLDKLSTEQEVANKIITEATGWLTRICDINFVVSLHFLDKIFSVTSLVTIMLQGVVIDLESDAHLLDICKANISNLRKKMGIYPGKKCGNCPSNLQKYTTLIQIRRTGSARSHVALTSCVAMKHHMTLKNA